MKARAPFPGEATAYLVGLTQAVIFHVARAVELPTWLCLVVAAVNTVVAIRVLKAIQAARHALELRAIHWRHGSEILRLLVREDTSKNEEIAERLTRWSALDSEGSPE